MANLGPVLQALKRRLLFQNRMFVAGLFPEALDIIEQYIGLSPTSQPRERESCRKCLPIKTGGSDHIPLSRLMGKAEIDLHLLPFRAERSAACSAINRNAGKAMKRRSWLLNNSRAGAAPAPAQPSKLNYRRGQSEESRAHAELQCTIRGAEQPHFLSQLFSHHRDPAGQEKEAILPPTHPPTPAVIHVWDLQLHVTGGLRTAVNKRTWCVLAYD